MAYTKGLGQNMRPGPLPFVGGASARGMRGFTITELVVVIVTVGILAVVALASHQRNPGRARARDCGAGRLAETAGTASYIERQITVIVSRCKDPSGTSPRYACP
jgi:prepilin-type N-terminal cleavage/methylation domain-containing protein